MSGAGVHLEDLTTLDTEVLVVGAGPTGLMAGLVLATRGVAAVVVDKKAGPTRESRALVVQARTMEIYDQLGLADQVLAGANSAIRFQIGERAGSGGLDIERLQRGATRFPGVQVFEQSRNEHLLYEALKQCGGEVNWSHRLVDLVDQTAASGGRVVALLDGPDGLLRVRARWCIGADGAASAVRRGLDLPFEGVTDDATFWVADVREVSGLPEDAVAARFGRSTFAIAFPLGPGGHTRLIALAPHDSITEEAALAVARQDLGLTLGRVDWFSTYRVQHRLASRLRKGSVFLAGDAGHVHSPVGGQGMNTGLQDAHNLALLLSDVVQGRLDVSAVDRYERERRPVAQRLVRVTDRAFGVIGRRGLAASLLRNRGSALGAALLPRIARSPLGARLGGYLGQYRIRYHYVEGQAPLPGWADDPAVGLRLPPVGNNHEPLRGLTWQLHTYGARDVTMPNRPNRPNLPEWIEGPHVFPADPRRRLKADRLYLVRPDGFVAASLALRSGTPDAGQLRLAIAAAKLLV